MSEPYLGEIRMFGGNYAPRGWALCDGGTLAVSQYDALFSLLGTTYGGDGRTTFALPDLRGRLPIHMGSGPGLTSRNLGHKGGAETVTVAVNQLPSHTHGWRASKSSATETNPLNNVTASDLANDIYSNDTSPTALMNAATITTHTGGGQAHTNVMPYLCVNFIIALTGLYPSRH